MAGFDSKLIASRGMARTNGVIDPWAVATYGLDAEPVAAPAGEAGWWTITTDDFAGYAELYIAAEIPVGEGASVYIWEPGNPSHYEIGVLGWAPVYEELAEAWYIYFWPPLTEIWATGSIVGDQQAWESASVEEYDPFGPPPWISPPQDSRLPIRGTVSALGEQQVMKLRIDDYFCYSFIQHDSSGYDSDAITPTFALYEQGWHNGSEWVGPQYPTRMAEWAACDGNEDNEVGHWRAKGQCTAAASFTVGCKYTVMARVYIALADEFSTVVLGEFIIVPDNVWNSFRTGSAKLAVDVVSFLGTAITTTAGRFSAAITAFFDVATPALTAESVNQTGDAYAAVNGLTIPAAGPELTEIVDGVWDAVATEHRDAGTLGNIVQIAPASDPLENAPGDYSAGSVGALLNDNLDGLTDTLAKIKSRGKQ